MPFVRRDLYSKSVNPHTANGALSRRNWDVGLRTFAVKTYGDICGYIYGILEGA